MGPLEMMALGSALGLGKSILIDKPKEKRERELAARTQELSPWTGLKAGAIQEADPFGSALKYGATGYSMSEDAADKEFKKEMMRKMAGQMAGGDNNNPYTQIKLSEEMQKPEYNLQAPTYLKGE